MLMMNKLVAIAVSSDSDHSTSKLLYTDAAYNNNNNNNNNILL